MEKHVRVRCFNAAVFAATVMLMLAGPTSPAWSGCSPMQILEFATAGYTQAQIDEVCGKSAADDNTIDQERYLPGYRCATDYGWCPMDAPAPVGSACACYTAYGTFEGMVVE